MQQKARDNRAVLKSSKRDVAELQDQEEQEEEEKIGHQQFGNVLGPSHPENRPGPHGLEGVKLQASQPIPLQQQSAIRVPSTSPISAQDYNNFVKPKPPSRYKEMLE